MDPTPSFAAPELFNLSGKNALVTGGTRGTPDPTLIEHLYVCTSSLTRANRRPCDLGIGAACAIALAQAGANICLVQRNPVDGSSPNLETYNAILALGVQAKVVHCDLADIPAVRSLFQTALDAMGGRIHILVNCAGIQRRSPCVDFSEKDWDDVRLLVYFLGPQLAVVFTHSGYCFVRCFFQVIDVNLKSVWLLCQAAGRHMIPLREGKIINFCSLMSYQGGLTIPAYAAAKGALGQLTKSLSNEWSQHNVQVNGIVPGYIATEM